MKLRSMWGYIVTHYLDKYDYFHIGGDDMDVIVEIQEAFSLSTKRKDMILVGRKVGHLDSLAQKEVGLSSFVVVRDIPSIALG